MSRFLACGHDALTHGEYDVRRDQMFCVICAQKGKQVFGVGSNVLNALALAQQNNQSLQNPYLGMGVLGGFTSSEMSRDYAEVERLRKLAEEEQQLLCLLTQGD